MLRLNSLNGFGAGMRALTTLSFVDSANSSAGSLTLPASIEPGDLLLLIQLTINSTTPTAVTPTGFTNLDNRTAALAIDDVRMMIDYKIADGSEDGASITGMDAGIDRKILLQFRGNKAISTLTIHDIAFEFTDGNAASQTCNAASGVVPLIVIGVYRSNATVDPRTFSPAADAEVAISTTFYVNYKIYNSSPADTTVDMDDDGSSNTLMSFYLQAA